ncbi:MAG: AAA family ATPase [Sphingomonadaceae bacterium]|nr:AAA family ATPase [Sphingomonadaceae bacterium]
MAAPASARPRAFFFCGAQLDAVYVEAYEGIGKKWLMTELARELHIKSPERTFEGLFHQVVEALVEQQRPIILDEADFLLKLNLIQVARKISDRSQMPILFVGEDTFPESIRRWGHVHNRVRTWVKAQPTDFEDARALRDNRCRAWKDTPSEQDLKSGRVGIADDLLHHFLTVSGGNARRLVTTLLNAQSAAKAVGVTDIDRAWWGDRPILTGELPARRLAA